ncbi:MAG: hypothetical protein PUB01_03055 [Desulfovibrionaceae bacterium]|nr:hypothetical protein [Desulfovibrionaceae bacterium]
MHKKTDTQPNTKEEQTSQPELEQIQSDNGIVTTEEEWQAYYLVKSLVMGTVNVNNVTIRDKKAHCNILYGDTQRQPLCRLYFNGKRKKVGIFTEDKNEEIYEIENIEDIMKHTETIRKTALFYENKN